MFSTVLNFLPMHFFVLVLPLRCRKRTQIRPMQRLRTFHASLWKHQEKMTNITG